MGSRAMVLSFLSCFLLSCSTHSWRKPLLSIQGNTCWKWWLIQSRAIRPMLQVEGVGGDGDASWHYLNWPLPTSLASFLPSSPPTAFCRSRVPLQITTEAAPRPYIAFAPGGLSKILSTYSPSDCTCCQQLQR